LAALLVRILRFGTFVARLARAFSHVEDNPMERKKASDFPQELLNLFDGYVHGALSRREFLEGAQKFAVGGITAAALFENA
jgi:hypothetical protein